MPDELLTESPEDKALLESIRTESAPPAEPAPEPAPEAPAAPAAPVAAEPPKPAEQRMVPQQALHEARQEARELKARLAALEAPKEPELDPTQDPIGVIQKQGSELAELRAQLKADAADRIYGQRAQAAVSEYIAKDPTYNDAALFLQQVRTRQLQALPNVAPENVNAMVMAEAKHLFKTLLDAGVNPAEGVVAQARAIGWQPRGATAPAPLAPAAAPAAPVPTPAPAPAPDTKAADERIARLERGQRAAGTSSGSGGRATAANDLSIEDLVNLDGAAFDSATAAFFKREKAAGNWS